VKSVHGAVTTYTYSGAVTEAAINTRWTRTTVDGFGRTAKVEQGTGSTTVSIVDTEYAPCACSPLGKVKRVSQPYASGGPQKWTTYGYDDLGRTLSVTLPDSAGTTTYAYAGNTVTVTDPAGKWKKYTVDGFGNLVTVEEPKPAGGSYQTTYTYNVLGKLLTATMPRDSTTQTRIWTYDANQRLSSTTFPENGLTTYVYNANGTLLRRTDAQGQKVEYVYDLIRRVTRVNRFKAGAPSPDPCQSVAFTYDVTLIAQIPSFPTGRLTQTEWGSANTTVCSGRSAHRAVRLHAGRHTWCKTVGRHQERCQLRHDQRSYALGRSPR
jgi:YD repeat-containing protein